MVLDSYYIKDAIDIRKEYFSIQNILVGSYSLKSDFASEKVQK